MEIQRLAVDQALRFRDIQLHALAVRLTNLAAPIPKLPPIRLRGGHSNCGRSPHGFRYQAN